MMQEIAAAQQVTSVVISHDMASTFRIAHQISMLSEGTIIESGTPDDFRRTQNPIVRRFAYDRLTASDRTGERTVGGTSLPQQG